MKKTITNRATNKNRKSNIPHGPIEEFKEDVRKGLTSAPKFIPSKYLYDDTGDRLFSTIMTLPEYYPTRSEYEILDTHKKEIIDLFSDGENQFEIIELGPGDGFKTKLLLGEIYNRNLSVTYTPIDISSHVLELLSEDLQKLFPTLTIMPVWKDYLAALKGLTNNNIRRIILFLGANIGNSTPKEALSFLKEIKKHLNPGDKALIGFDLKKHPRDILQAYDDKSGITRAFNLNLLKRINNELSANFNLSGFDHYPSYNPVTGETESFLISLSEQTVHLGKLNMSIKFKAWETIKTELSQKYTMEDIEELSSKAGLKLMNAFYDQKRFYTDCLFEIIS
ncbi:MAG TPA: L-histidine N(alpha)-methyltransferase [Cytophagaceae bacterium]